MGKCYLRSARYVLKYLISYLDTMEAMSESVSVYVLPAKSEHRVGVELRAH